MRWRLAGGWLGLQPFGVGLVMFGAGQGLGSWVKKVSKGDESYVSENILETAIWHASVLKAHGYVAERDHQ